MRAPALLSIALLAACAGGTNAVKSPSAGPATAITPSPSTYGPPPEARKSMALAYDASRKSVVLFGGRATNGQPLFDTWTWDGSGWTNQHPAASPAIRDGRMTYDAARQRVILFGTPIRMTEQTAPVPPGETWTWDGRSWQKEAPKSSPSARYAPLMAYDTARKRVILFGGGGRPNESFGDTWAWDGTTWLRLGTMISDDGKGSGGGAMAYDEAHQVTVIYDFPGGDPGDREMWFFDGSTWSERPAGTTPLPLQGHGMVYDQALGRVVLFGGEGAAIPPSTRTVTSDIWLWDGATWTKRPSAGQPPPRGFMGLVYMADSRQILVFGGLTSANGQDVNLNDTWTYDGIAWAKRA